MADPTNVVAIDDVEIHTGFNVRAVVATPEDIAGIIGQTSRLDETVHQVIEEEAEQYGLDDDAEQAAERLRDGYADYFSRYDALITHVLPIPAHKHGFEEFTINGQTVDATYLQGATVPLNVTGLPGLSMRFGTSKEGLPINVQLVGKWQAESTILHLAALLETASPVRNLHPEI